MKNLCYNKDTKENNFHETLLKNKKGDYSDERVNQIIGKFTKAQTDGKVCLQISKISYREVRRYVKNDFQSVEDQMKEDRPMYHFIIRAEK